PLVRLTIPATPEPSTLSLHYALPILLANRQRSSGLRLSWALSVLPAGAMLVAAWLTLPMSVPAVLGSALQCACAVLLGIWLVERGAPLPALPRPWSILLPAWPALAGLLVWLGF